MKISPSKRAYVNIIISLIVSLMMVLPMILGMMGYDIFNRRSVPQPSRVISFWVVARQWLLYFLMVFILMVVNTIENPRIKLLHKLVPGVIITVVFYFLFALVRPDPPVPEMPARPSMNDPALQQARPPFPGQPEMRMPEVQFRNFGPNYRRITEFIFILVITTLLGKVLELVNLRQQMLLENEQLRSENLQNRYDVLLNQINPHFFFNSLNSLSSLVRDGRKDNALKYIDELSNTYRYAMQSSGKVMVTVTDELESLKAYSYLLQIRFEDKLFIEINIDEKAGEMLLPVLSLQPLVENVVKHNVISSDAPLTITITGNKNGISVINPIRPRNDVHEKSGMGLNNLSNRYRLLTGHELIVETGNGLFSVTLPLIKPEEG
jgi:two-component system LytT family sensor kinase